MSTTGSIADRLNTETMCHVTDKYQSISKGPRTEIVPNTLTNTAEKTILQEMVKRMEGVVNEEKFKEKFNYNEVVLRSRNLDLYNQDNASSKTCGSFMKSLFNEGKRKTLKAIAVSDDTTLPLDHIKAIVKNRKYLAWYCHSNKGGAKINHVYSALPLDSNGTVNCGDKSLTTKCQKTCQNILQAYSANGEEEDFKDSKDSKDSKESKESKDSKDSKGSKESNEPEESKESEKDEAAEEGILLV
jgi:hypothetical protein